MIASLNILIKTLFWVVVATSVSVCSTSNNERLASKSTKADNVSSSNTPTVVAGYFDGSLSVHQGMAMYTINIEVPPGTNGIQPELILAYNNRAQNGVTGVGFKLSGLSSIVRCGSTYLRDGYVNGINYDLNDNFCLNSASNRLMQISTADTHTTFRAELDELENIVADIGSSTNCTQDNPCSFTVYKRDGSTWEYGTSTDAAVPAIDAGSNTLPAGMIRTWLLNRVTDLNGNSMSISYSDSPDTIDGSDINDQGRAYVSNIAYTANTNGNMEANRQVKFLYQSGRADPMVQFEGGAKYSTTALLAQIETSLTLPDGRAQIVHEYNLSYGRNPLSMQSRLGSVQLCDGNANCFQPIDFQWSGGPDSFHVKDIGSNSLNGNTGYTGDYNGDGLSDVIVLFNSSAELYLNNPKKKHFTTSTPLPDQMTIGTSNAYSADYNADGLEDFLIISDTTNLFLASASGEFTCVKDTQNTCAAFTFTQDGSRFPGDFNGDGMSDLLVTTPEKSLLYLADNSTNSLTFTLSDAGQNIQSGLSHNYAADFNGDGIIDFLAGSEETLYLAQQSDEGLSFVAHAIDNVPQNSNGLWVGDFNGDGLADILATSNTGTILLFGNGVGFTPVDQTINLPINMSNNWPADFNGDGLMDIFDGTTGYLYYATGQNFKCIADSNTSDGCQVLATGLDPTSTWLGDYNGDGLTDLYVAAGSGNKVFYMGKQSEVTPENQRPDLLTRITNSIGGRTSLYFKPITDTSVYQASTTLALPQLSNVAAEAKAFTTAYNPTPLSSIQSPTASEQLVHSGSYVLAGYTLSNDTLTNPNKSPYAYSYNFSYQNGRFNRLGRGWLGFQVATETDTILDRIKSEWIRQDFPYAGQAETSALCSLSGTTNGMACDENNDTLLSLTDFSYDCHDTVNQRACVVNNSVYSDSDTKLFMVRHTQTVKSDLSMGSRVESNWQHDGSANVLLHEQLGDTNNGSNPIYTCYGYYPATQSPYIIGQTQYKKVTADSHCLDHVDTWQDDTDFRLTQFVYTAGNEVKQRLMWDNDNNGWYGHEYDRDTFGNAHKVSRVFGDPVITIPGSTWTYDYDTTFNTFNITRISPEPGNGNSQALTESYGWDARFGVRVVKQDANGNIVNRCLDGFARVTSIQQSPPKGSKPIYTGLDTNCISTDTYPYLDTNFIDNTSTYTVQSHMWEQNNQDYTKITKTRESWQNKNFYQRTEFMDGMNRKIKEQAPNDSGPDTLIETRYLNEKLKSQQSLPYLDGEPHYWHTVEYDAYARVEKIRAPYFDMLGNASESLTHMEYRSPNTIISHEADDTDIEFETKQTFSYYRNRKKLASVETNKTAKTSYERDLYGRPIKIKLPNNLNGERVENKVNYDSLGRRKNTSETNSGKRVYTYSTDGNLKDITDSKKQLIAFTYDNLQRTLSNEYQNGSGQVVGKVSFIYDQNPQSEFDNLMGKLAIVKEVDKSGNQVYQYQYGYDAIGNQSERTLSIDKYDFASNTLYNPNRSMASHTYPSGNGNAPLVRFGYSPITGLLVDVDLASDGTTFKNYLSYSNFNAFGLPENAVYGDKSNEAKTYNPAGLLQRHSVLDSNGDSLLNNVHGWDYLNNLTDITDCDFTDNATLLQCLGAQSNSNSANKSQQFTFIDKRLTQATGPYGQLTYCYDNAGNLTQKQGINYTYSGHQVQQGFVAANTDCNNPVNGNQVYDTRYDANGNLSTRTVEGISTLVLGSNVSDTDTRFTYDVLNRITNVTVDNVLQEANVYDYRGRRVMKSEYNSDGSSVSQATVYASRGYEVSILPDQSLQTLYVLGGGNRIASVQDHISLNNDVASLRQHLLGLSSENLVTIASLPEELFFHQNIVNSTQLVTQGTQTSSVDYTPYGLATIVPDDGPDFRYTYTGKELDAAAGIYYFGARHYDPLTGRFASADSQLGGHHTRQDAFNRYAYALNSPAEYNDPTGHFSLAKIIPFALTVATELILDVVTDGAAAIATGEEISADAAILGEKTTAEVAETASETKTEVDATEEAAQQAKDNPQAENRDIDNDTESQQNRAQPSDTAEQGPAQQDDMQARDSSSCAIESSFSAGTMVAVKDGFKAIEDIRPGDTIWSFNEQIQRKELNTVLRTFSHKASDLIEVALNDIRVIATPEHPFWADDTWVTARELKAGSLLVDQSGSKVHISGVRQFQQPQAVYNLEVDSTHNYYVTTFAVLVHNVRCPPPGVFRRMFRFVRDSFKDASLKDFQKAGEDTLMGLPERINEEIEKFRAAEEAVRMLERNNQNIRLPIENTPIESQIPNMNNVVPPVDVNTTPIEKPH